MDKNEVLNLKYHFSKSSFLIVLSCQLVLTHHSPVRSYFYTPTLADDMLQSMTDRVDPCEVRQNAAVLSLHQRVSVNDPPAASVCCLHVLAQLSQTDCSYSTILI